MEIEIQYRNKDLTSGVCTCCKEYSNHIVKADGRCTDCLEEEIFFNETMKNNDL